MTEIRVDRRFCGPPDSANGGYFAGLAARLVDGPAEITLKLPPPLEQPMEVRVEDGAGEVLLGDAVVAQIAPTSISQAPAPPVGFDDAAAASGGFAYAGRDHPFPTCFVCGPQADRGLGLHPGPSGAGVAAPWIPEESLAGQDGRIRPEFVWAALDCPSFFGALSADASIPRRTVLGRIAVDVVRTPRVGERLVVQGWPLGRSGRKIRAGSGVYGADGVALAQGVTTWIALE
jgi:hypothetical protein